MHHEMKLNDEPFEQILLGLKSIEARIYDEKRQHIQLDDTIIFTRISNNDDKIKVKVLGLSRFNSFKDMFIALPLPFFGFKDNQNPAKALDVMRKYYSESEEILYGVLGIHIVKIKNDLQ